MNVRIKFLVRATTRWGDTICVVGNVPELGNWDPYNGARLRTDASKYSLWESDHVNIFLKEQLEYKYVNLTGDGSVAWEAGYFPKNRFINPQRLEGFKEVAFDDGMFSSVLGVRKIKATVESVSKKVREENPKIKLMGNDEQFYYVDTVNEISDTLIGIGIRPTNYMTHSLWIQYRGILLCTGGSSMNVVHSSTYKFVYDIADESNDKRRVKAVTLTYVEMAPMNRPRWKHKGVVVGKFVYVVGGNADCSAEKYDVESNKWTLIPSNSRDFSNGSLTLIDGRYLLAVRQVFRTRTTPSDIYAERLDILDEESGWESLQLNLERSSFEPHALSIQQAGNGKLSVLINSIEGQALLYLFDMDRNRIVRKDQLQNFMYVVSFVKYEQGCVKWHCFHLNTGRSVHHRLIKGKELNAAYCKYDSLEAKGMEVTKNVIELKAASA